MKENRFERFNFQPFIIDALKQTRINGFAVLNAFEESDFVSISYGQTRLPMKYKHMMGET